MLTIIFSSPLPLSYERYVIYEWPIIIPIPHCFFNAFLQLKFVLYPQISSRSTHSLYCIANIKYTNTTTVQQTWYINSKPAINQDILQTFPTISTAQTQECQKFVVNNTRALKIINTHTDMVNVNTRTEFKNRIVTAFKHFLHVT